MIIKMTLQQVFNEHKFLLLFRKDFILLNKNSILYKKTNKIIFLAKKKTIPYLCVIDIFDKYLIYLSWTFKR